MLKFLLLGMLALPLIGCTTAPLPPEVGSVDMGKFTLNKPLSIAAGSARAFIQAGHSVIKPDSRDPVCVFESWKVSEQGQSVMSDRFRIADVYYRRGDVSGGFGVYGSTDMGMGLSFGLGGLGSPVYPAGVGRFGDQPRLTQAATIMRLVSERQPLMYQLTCFSETGWAPFVSPPSVSEMNAVLGDLAHIELTTKESVNP